MCVCVLGGVMVVDGDIYFQCSLWNVFAQVLLSNQRFYRQIAVYRMSVDDLRVADDARESCAKKILTGVHLTVHLMRPY